MAGKMLKSGQKCGCGLGRKLRFRAVFGKRGVKQVGMKWGGEAFDVFLL